MTIQYYTKLCERLERAIDLAPDGRISYRRYEGRRSVPYRIGGSGKKRIRQRLDPSDAVTIELLRNKTAALAVLPKVRHNLAALRHAGRMLRFDMYSIFRSMGEEFVPCADLFLGRINGHEPNPAFDCLKERQNPFPFDANAVTTRYGRFRSKSEAMLAEMITATGARFKYEPAIIVAGRTLYADFAVDRTWRSDIGIIEHNGLIDRPDYRAKKLEDLRALMDCGYYPGIQLLILSESRKDGFDAELARKLIEAFCLPC